MFAKIAALFDRRVKPLPARSAIVRSAALGSDAFGSMMPSTKYSALPSALISASKLTTVASSRDTPGISATFVAVPAAKSAIYSVDSDCA